MDALTYPDRTPHTGLMEVKQVYCPIRVEQGQNQEEFVLRSLLTQIDAGELLEGYYEISVDGEIIPGESFEFHVEPFGQTVIAIEGLDEYSDKDSYIRFIFTTHTDTEYCEKGYEVCFDQIRIGTEIADEKTYGKDTVEAIAESEIRVTEEPLFVYVSAGETTYRFNKRKSVMDSICYKGKELLEKPLEFNFFRAPVDNDVMRGDWYRVPI